MPEISPITNPSEVTPSTTSGAKPDKKRFSLVRYVKNSYIELRKVTWPTRAEAIRSTGIVILFSTIVALFLGGLDFVFNELLSYLISLQ